MHSEGFEVLRARSEELDVLEYELGAFARRRRVIMEAFAQPSAAVRLDQNRAFDEDGWRTGLAGLCDGFGNTHGRASTRTIDG
jgi:hypothetical protein